MNAMKVIVCVAALIAAVALLVLLFDQAHLVSVLN